MHTQWADTYNLDHYRDKDGNACNDQSNDRDRARHGNIHKGNDTETGTKTLI